MNSKKLLFLLPLVALIDLGCARDAAVKSGQKGEAKVGVAKATEEKKALGGAAVARTPALGGEEGAAAGKGAAVTTPADPPASTATPSPALLKVEGPPVASAKDLFPGEGRLYATFVTSMGKIVIELLEADAPLTVANFVGLALGKVAFRTPQGEVVKRPLYDGTIFHRVIPRFMIQGGDPAGNGTGGPGYRFRDEPQSLAFDRPGLLAMANSGPNTNGSQFFITEVPTPHLNGRHTIFGKVISGEPLVAKIARVEAGPGNRPLQTVTLLRVEISRGATPSP